MGWEKRGARSVYYRKRRAGGRVLSTHCGSGDFATLLAKLDAAERADRHADRLKIEAHNSTLDAHNRAVTDLCGRIEGVVRAVLDALGYHRHDRGEWRKRRMTGQGRTLATVETSAALPAVREAADLARLAMAAAIDSAAGKDAFFAASLRRRVEKLQRELVGADPSPLERLLAERVAVCWIQVHQLELLATDAARRQVPTLEAVERRRDRAHRRYLQSLKSLAQIRRLALPALVQVNIGQQQVIAPSNRG
jgi:hypothetical protein